MRSPAADAGGFNGYQIGTVANLTGLDPHTIRAWERRYGAVHPVRSEGGTRRYGEADVARLQLLKALTDCGEPIRLVAPLSDDELRERLEKLAGLGPPEAVRAAPDAPAGSAPRIALLHPALDAQRRDHAGALRGLEVELARDDRDAFLEALPRHPCDVLVLALERMGPEPQRTLDACLEASGARLVVIVYQFARRGLLARLGNRGAKLVRGPLRLEQLRRAVLDLLVIEEARRRRGSPAPARLDRSLGGGMPPERVFDDAQLARLAEVASAVDCECPNHLSSLVASLAAFEAYSHGCESRDAADAALHARLGRGTGQARALLEQLLVELCEHDGIPIPPGSGSIASV